MSNSPRSFPSINSTSFAISLLLVVSVLGASLVAYAGQPIEQESMARSLQQRIWDGEASPGDAFAAYKSGFITRGEFEAIVLDRPLAPAPSVRAAQETAASSLKFLGEKQPRRIGQRAEYDEGFEGANTFSEVTLTGANTTDGWRLQSFNVPTGAGSTAAWAGPQGSQTAYAPGVYTALTTAQQVDLTGFTTGDTITLSWQQNLRLGSDPSDFFRVEVQDGDGNWSVLVENLTTDTAGWTDGEASLSAFAGESIRVRFVFHSDSDAVTDPGAFIDNVSIVAASGSSNLLPIEMFDDFLDVGTPPTGWTSIGTVGPWGPFLTADRGTVAACEVPAKDGLRDEQLISPEFDATNASGVTLRFWQTTNQLTGTPAQMDVDVTVNSGASWTTVYTAPLDPVQNEVGYQDVDLSTLADGESQVRVRFRFVGTRFSGEWQVDDVEVFASSGQQALFTNGFEGNLNAWSFDDLSGPGDFTTIIGGDDAAQPFPDGYGIANTGDSSRLLGDTTQARTNGNSSNPNGEGAYWPVDYDLTPLEQAIVSPSVDLSGIAAGESVTLVFANRRFGSFAQWHVDYSLDGGQSWIGQTFTQPTNPNLPLQLGGWQRNSLLLNGAAGESDVRVRFRMQTVRASDIAFAYWYLDDVSIDVDSEGPDIVHETLGNTWSDDPRTVAFSVSDPSGVGSNPILLFRDGAGGSTRQVTATDLGGGNFEATLDPPDAADSVEYWFLAFDSLGNQRTLPEGGAGTTAPPSTFSYAFLPTSNDILLTYDGTKTDPNVLIAALGQLGVDFDAYNNNEELLPAGGLTDYNVVIWEEGGALPQSTIDELVRWLDQPGRERLLIASDSIGFNHGTTQFYEEYLHAEFVQIDSGYADLLSIANEDVSGGVDVTLAERIDYSLNEIDFDPSWRGSGPVYEYDDSPADDLDSGFAAVRNVDDDFATVYLGFPFTAYGDTTAIAGLIERADSWMKDAVIPTPSPTPSNTPTVTSTPTITFTPTITPTPSNTPTPTDTPVPVTPSETPTPTNTATATPTPEATTDYDLQPGWNSIALNVDPTPPLRASDFIALLQSQGVNVSAVTTLRRGRWAFYVQGIPTTDFDLRRGEGYLVYVLDPGGTVTVPGEPATGSSVVAFNAGWTLRGVLNPPVGYTSDDLCTDMVGAGTGEGYIALYDGRAYRVTSCQGASPAAFAITDTVGYFVYTDAEVFFLPSP